MQEGLGYACQYETCQMCLWLRRCFKLVTGPVAVSSLVMKSKSQSNGGSRSRKMRVRAAEAQEVYIDGASLSPFVACSSCSSFHHQWSLRHVAATRRAGARSRPPARSTSHPASRKASFSPHSSCSSSSRPRSGAGLYAAKKVPRGVEGVCGCSEAS